MTGRGDCAVMRRELGVYVLRAIDPADRSVLEEHLASCPRCREELASLAGLSALLGKVPIADAWVLCGQDAGEDGRGAVAPENLLDALLDRVARMRRRRRWRLAAVAAVLIAATAAAWGLHVRQPAVAPSAPAGSRWAATAAGFNPATRAGATVRYAARAWGTQLEVRVTGIPAGTTCQFWVTSTTGQDIAAGPGPSRPGNSRRGTPPPPRFRCPACAASRSPAPGRPW